MSFLLLGILYLAFFILAFNWHFVNASAVLN
jgi:hypothetical protein